MPPFAKPGMASPRIPLTASPDSPALPPAALPVGLALGTHLGTHPGTHPGTRTRACPGMQCSLVAPLQAPAHQAWLWLAPEPRAWVPTVGEPCHPTREPQTLLLPCHVLVPFCTGTSKEGTSWGSSSPSREGVNCVQEHPISASTPPRLPQCFSSQSWPDLALKAAANRKGAWEGGVSSCAGDVSWSQPWMELAASASSIGAGGVARPGCPRTRTPAGTYGAGGG